MQIWLKKKDSSILTHFALCWIPVYEHWWMTQEIESHCTLLLPVSTADIILTDCISFSRVAESRIEMGNSVCGKFNELLYFLLLFDPDCLPLKKYRHAFENLGDSPLNRERSLILANYCIKIKSSYFWITTKITYLSLNFLYLSYMGADIFGMVKLSIGCWRCRHRIV